MKLWFFSCALCVSAIAAAQTQTAVLAPTKITQVQTSNTTRVVEVSPIQLGSPWKVEGLLSSIRSLELVTSTATLSVEERQLNQGIERVVIKAHYRNAPIFDRDIVVLVDATGRVQRVNANLPRFETAHAANINVEQSLAILNEHLLRHYGPTNLTPSASRKTGWLQFGNQLYPITEVEVLDPIGFRHFTARVDRVNARVISVTERTKH